MLLLGIVVALAGRTPSPEDPAAVAAEARRITTELKSYAAEGKQGGVERSYRELLGLGVLVDDDVHVTAANVAKDRGEAFKALARLMRVPQGSPAANSVRQTYVDLERYGYVRITARVGAVVHAPSFFSPDEGAAAELMVKQVRETGAFLGLLPAGDYQIDGATLRVPSRYSVNFPAPPRPPVTDELSPAP